MASYSIPQLLLRVPLGLWSDALGRRKPFLIGGIATTIVGALALGLAPSVWLLFLGRAITGIGAASWVAFTVMFASYFPSDKAARAMGILSFVNGAAIVAVSALGGVMAQELGSKSTFFGAVGFGLVGLALLLPVRELVLENKQAFSRRAFLQVATRPLLLVVAGMSILLQFVIFAGVFSFISVYASQIGASKTDLGVITMLFLGTGAVTALVAPYLVERYGYSRTLSAAAVLMGVATLAVPFIQQVYLLELLQVVSGAGRGILFTLLLSLSIQAVPHEQRATAMGVYQALYAVGMLLGPLLSGVLADGLGLSSVFYLSALLCLAIGAMAYLPVLPKRQRY